MKKFLALLLAVALLALFAGTALASTSVRFTGDANVRSGPGLGYKSKGTVKKGAKLSTTGPVKFDGRGVAWYAVTFKGATRWVSSRYARLSDTDKTKSGKNVKGATGDSHVRRTPNLSGQKLGILKKGKTARFLNCVSCDSRGVAWYAVSFGGKIGWVSSRYTKIS